MNTPSNTAKLGTALNNIQTAQRGPSLVGSELIQCISQHTTESAHLHTLKVRHKRYSKEKNSIV